MEKFTDLLFCLLFQRKPLFSVVRNYSVLNIVQWSFEAVSREHCGKHFSMVTYVVKGRSWTKV